mmetsp:Transcript_21576/g.71468  ORF Transcript_21576/g.71468 Transcript_21576/m.71468 type:complete len:425 (-) Transcript_21576:19-1293(-)
MNRMRSPMTCLLGNSLLHASMTEQDLAQPGDGAEDISECVRQLATGDDATAARAARYLFQKAHAADKHNRENKEKMDRQGAVNALCSILRSGSVEARYQACSALSELAYQNEKICMAIINAPGCLECLRLLLQEHDGNNQEDAALVINNCAAFSQHTPIHIVQFPGMLDAIRSVANGRHVGARNAAISALNCMSRSIEAAQALIHARIVEEVLTPILSEKGRGEKYEARVARAVLAIANIMGAKGGYEICAPVLAKYPNHLEMAVNILGHSLNGLKWGGILFALYSVIIPMSHLSAIKENQARLVELGMIEKLARVLREWQPGHLSDSVMERVLLIILSINDQPEFQHRIRLSGLIAGLQQIQLGLRNEPPQCRALAEQLLSSLLECHVAVCMGQHARLGADSPLMLLDDFVSSLILDMAFPMN